MRAEGYETAAAHFSIPEALQDSAGIPSIRNRFTCFSILNEFTWALDPNARFPDDSIVEVRKDKWFDLNNPHDTAPSPRADVLARRRIIQDYMERVRDADVVVITLGLAEAWFDTKTGHYINVGPYRSMRAKEPDRFEFHLLEYEDVLGAVERIHALLVAHGKPDFRMLITVSPVALGASYSGSDVLIANTYSKAVQRAAVEAFVRRHDDVDYFPSFESVTLSDRMRAWRADQAHASEEIVRLNVLRMLRAYGEEPLDEAVIGTAEEAYALASQARRMFADGDIAGAAAAYAKASAMAPGEALIRFRHADFLVQTKQFKTAIVEARAARNSRRPPADSLYMLGRAYHGAGEHEAAYETLCEALKLDPRRGGLLYLLAKAAAKTGRDVEALHYIDTLIGPLKPGHPVRARALADRERITARIGAAPVSEMLERA